MKKLGESLIERMELRVERVPFTGCWLWTGSVTARGYGLFKTDRQHQAHRVSYEAFKGPIPQGLHIDHLCRVHCCVNPDHLEAVTCKENIRRGLTGETAKINQLGKTHCKHGHERTDKNTYVTNRGTKCCRVCILAKQRASYQKRINHVTD